MNKARPATFSMPAIDGYDLGHDAGPTEPRLSTDTLVDLLDALVMMVDDEPINIEVSQIHLEEAGYTRFVSTSEPREALDLLASARPDVLLLDLMMPGMSGFEILRRMEVEGILKNVPTIVLTSSTDAETKLQALEFGATDFLAKPVDSSELILRLRNTLAAKAYRDRLANFDLLTGLPNRETFMDRLNWALRSVQRYASKGAVLHLGLDDFKQLNEALGPGIADAALQTVAQRLEDCLRKTDTVSMLSKGGPPPSLSRLGGGEFALLLPAIAAADDAACVARRVLAAIAAPVELSGHDLAITCSVGIAVFPTDGSTSDAIVRNAGSAMHHAKEHKNACRFYSSEMNARALHNLSLAAALRRALERDELRLFYQPKVNITTGGLAGTEALVRWDHPEKGLLSPSEFVPLAEENGLVVPLGECVMRIACAQSRAWQSAGYAVPRISINVSGHQFRHGQLAAIFASILDAAGAQARNFCIELTEGVIMDNAQLNIKTLHQLKEMGAELAIDDFGTGYSSLSYLNKFPLDELKIDRSFVAEITASKQSSAIIKAIIVMAHSLDLRVVAEGVETETQLAFLKAQTCDEYQGYLKSKPIAPDEFERRFLMNNTL